MSPPPPSSLPRLFPETVPGGSLIGSVNSRFAATFTLYQSRHHQSGAIRSPAPTDPSLNSNYPSHTDACTDADITNTIQSLSRSKIEALVTQAWIRNISNQSEEKLRDLVSSAVSKGILNHDDIHSTCTNSFTSLPTQIQLRIVSYLPLRSRIVFLTQINKQFIHFAHHPQLWTEIDLQMPFQSNFFALSNFLMKYTPANSVEKLSFPSSTRSHEFLKFLVTLKRLKSRLTTIHLSGKHIENINLAAMESLLGKWTHTIILDNPCTKVDVGHITPLISAAPRLKTLALQTCNKFSSSEYDGFLRDLMRAGETSRLHHRHPEINARLRSLQVSCTSMQNVKFNILADLGKFFPLLEMLRVENWRFMDVNTKVVPIKTLRGLSLVGIDVEKNGFIKMLSMYLKAFPALEIIFLGARELDVLGWKLFIRKPEVRGLFKELQLPKLKCLWLRAWSIDFGDLVSLKADALQWIVFEECKGMNGGWKKIVCGKWKRAVVVESDTRLKYGIDFSMYRDSAKRKLGFSAC